MSETDTSHISRNSMLGKIGVNVRGVIVVLLCLTVCVLTTIKTEIPKELYWLTSAAVTYYFGQKHTSDK